VIEFVHDPAKVELTLTLVEKPWLLPESVLWSGFSQTLDRAVASARLLPAVNRSDRLGDHFRWW